MMFMKLLLKLLEVLSGVEILLLRFGVLILVVTGLVRFILYELAR